MLTEYIDTNPSAGPIRNPLPPSSSTPSEFDWRDESIYFVLTDRFEDGEASNNEGVDKGNLVKYHGGDIQGLINKLDYIKGLGMSTIWLTPVMDNQDEFIDCAGYHGYWPIDFNKVDEHLGDMKKFEEFVEKAHKKDMKVLLDIPLNHTAWQHPFNMDPEKQDWFHHNGDVTDWNDQWQVENCSMYGLQILLKKIVKLRNILLIQQSSG